MNKSKLACYFLSVLFILMGACAKISAPTGGPRDRLPPVVVKCVPVNRAVNFKKKSISITFDEYVALGNINDKFMVSPPMKKKPRVFIRGKSVNVEFEDELKDSTTYTFYFQDAIKDLNEGNILENYQFIFSTGPVIDSLSVTGNVYNSYTLEVPEKTLVLLYRELADSAVVKHLPIYISSVDPTGYFRIDNVRSGTYRLYALKEADNSKCYNLPEEEFAFLNSPIVITTEKNFLPVVIDTTTIKKIIKKVPEPVVKKAKTFNKVEEKIPEIPTLKGEYQLSLFKALKKVRYLTSSDRPLNYQMIYTLSLPPDSLKFEFSIPGFGDDKYLTERSKNKDTIKVWLADSSLYLQPQITTMVKYPFTDSTGMLGYKEDTILMRFLTPRAPRVTKVKKPVFSFNSNISSGSLKPGQIIVFTAQTPFRQPDTSRIRLYELVDTKKLRIPFKLIKDSSNNCRYFLNAKIIQKKKYLFIADSASFGSIYNEYSDSTGIKFSLKDPESYGKLTLNITNIEGDRIIQLLDNAEKVISEVNIKKDGIVVFPLLENGSYRIRAIYDLNGDGKWTTGNFDTGRLPEPVSYYKQEIEVKAGFFIENEWVMGAENEKSQKLRAKKTL